jgi:porin
MIRKTLNKLAFSLLATVIVLEFSTLSSWADEAGEAHERLEPPDSIKRLFGDTIPYPDPESSGVTLYTLLMHDAFVNTTGGNDRGGGAIGNFYLSLDLNTEKLKLWESGNLHLEGVGIYGRSPAKVVGDYQYTSNIDSPDTIEPYQLYYEHTFFDERLSWLFGVHDYSLEFAVVDYGWDFVHSSFWTPATMTQLWWSFYPTTGLGSRAKLQISESAYLMAGVYDGRPSSQDNNRRIDWGLSKTDGAHTLVELAIDESSEGVRPYKVALGGWYSSGEFEGADGSTMRANSGSYLIGQTMLYGEDGDFERGLGGFMQISQAAITRNFNTWYFGGGLRYKGLLSTRPEDVLGIAWARAEIGSRYRENDPGAADSYESNVEVTYRAGVLPWLVLQPAVQIVRNPGADPGLDDAVVLYLRSEVLL